MEFTDIFDFQQKIKNLEYNTKLELDDEDDKNIEYLLNNMHNHDNLTELINTKDANGDTPLTYIAEKYYENCFADDYADIIKTLHANGADINIKNNFGKTAYEVISASQEYKTLEDTLSLLKVESVSQVSPQEEESKEDEEDEEDDPYYIDDGEDDPSQFGGKQKKLKSKKLSKTMKKSKKRTSKKLKIRFTQKRKSKGKPKRKRSDKK